MTEQEYRKELAKMRRRFFWRCMGVLAVPVVFIGCLWRLGLIEIILKTPGWAWCAMIAYALVCWVVGGLAEMVWKAWKARGAADAGWR